MKRTAYDILGVPPTATQEEIAAAYGALRIKLDPHAPDNLANPDAELRYKVLQESHYLIGNPVRRGAYDATLRGAVAPANVEPLGESLQTGRRKFMMGALMVVVLLAMGVTTLYQRKSAEYERERQRIIEAEKAAEQEAANTPTGYSDEESRQRNAEARVRAEMEAARREGASIHSQLQYQEEAARRQAERERQRQEQQERMDQARAERDAAMRRNQERYRAATSDRNGGAGVVAVPHPGRPLTDPTER